jgi:diguanylate cyclase (GGDEF)-like protein
MGGARDRRAPARILVVDDEEDLRYMLARLLEAHGYEVAVAADGETAVAMAPEFLPDLVLLDVAMPAMDGVEVVRRLRKHPKTTNVSVIMVTARTLSKDKVVGLTAGADDYVVKPFEPDELIARIETALRRTVQTRDASPLTGLPGNLRVIEAIDEAIESGRGFAVLYADLDHFKAYNDRAGPERADELIREAADVIQVSVDRHAERGTTAFVGHIGGDDFIAVTEPELAERTAAGIVRDFDARVGAYYSADDLERGAVEVEDRTGNRRQVPLVSISVGVATTLTRTFAHRAEVIDVATEMKRFAKPRPGSAYAIDRRGPGEPETGA